MKGDFAGISKHDYIRLPHAHLFCVVVGVARVPSPLLHAVGFHLVASFLVFSWCPIQNPGSYPPSMGSVSVFVRRQITRICIRSCLWSALNKSTRSRKSRGVPVRWRGREHGVCIRVPVGQFRQILGA